MATHEAPEPGAVVLVPGPGSIAWLARVEAVRERDGRAEVRIVPVAGAGLGAAWVSAGSVVPVEALAAPPSA